MLDDDFTWIDAWLFAFLMNINPKVTETYKWMYDMIFA